MILLNLFIIAFLCVFIIDYSGVIDSLDRGLTRALRSRIPLHIPKPFSCSLCSSWWASIIYLIIIGKFNFYYLLAASVFCALTPEILSAIYFLKDIVNKVFDVLERWLRIF